ncbi:MAG: hypothetical protein HY928_14185 [Elusimicrobia bacterium]|nr:hypothetical protein [Elusimicrobiota bacterium]
MNQLFFNEALRPGLLIWLIALVVFPPLAIKPLERFSNTGEIANVIGRIVLVPYAVYYTIPGSMLKSTGLFKDMGDGVMCPIGWNGHLLVASFYSGVSLVLAEGLLAVAWILG